jgi:NAD(P)-dependent dehydrogenase (short-subunit alcohol dehydrogenase family)
MMYRSRAVEGGRVEKLEGAGAVITGGASGIGFATAKVLGGRGARVVLADIEEPVLDTAVGALREAGVEAHGVLCDVRSLDAVQRLADEAFDRLGAVHLLFNNAGVAIAGPIVEMSHEDWRWIVDVDLWGPIHGVEAFVPRLVEQGQGGHVLFTSSFAGLVPNVGLGPYCVAKYGVVALAEVLQRELRPNDIGVSVLCPMRVDTGIFQSERNRPADYGTNRSGTGSAVQGEGLSTVERVFDAGYVAELTVDAILANRLYVLPHEESRDSIRRRFERIDRAFDQ